MLRARPTPKSPKEKLEQYCRDQGKPKPSYKVEKVNGKYRATVYVAKTCGRLTGDLAKTRWDAEMNASQLLLQKLGL
jgi:dsRNA-specific ribonuclease